MSEPITLVYCGVHITHDGVFHKWAIYTEPLNLENARFFAVKGKNWRSNNIVKCQPGSIFQFQTENDEVSTINSKFLGFIADKDLVTELQIKNKLNIELYQADKSLEKEANLQFDRALLEPIRKTYQNLHNLQKPLLIAQIVRFITANSAENPDSLDT